nr:hypothetical protein [uncultured Cetobacterium sp.]
MNESVFNFISCEMLEKLDKMDIDIEISVMIAKELGKVMSIAKEIK